MKSALAVLGLALFSGLAPASGATHAASVPPKEFIDRGACPFECCVYREWTTEREVTLVDRPRGTRVVATIPAKRRVTGVTGQVISKPVRWVAVRDLEATSDADNAPAETIRKGETYWVLHYSGEGYWAVWHKGRVKNVSLDAPDGAPEGGAGDTSVWWVQIRTTDGKTGWAISTDNFGNQDSCG